MKILWAAAASTLEYIRRFRQFSGLECNACQACGQPAAGALTCPENDAMLDVIMLAIGLGFFGLSALYGQACDQL